MPDISVIIIAFNSQTTIERCVASAAQLSRDVVVVDSFSSDRTVAIAKQYTTKVFRHPWSGYGPQKEFALTNIINDWVLWIDSDEEVPLQLQQEIRSLDFSVDGYYIPIKPYFLNRWLTHGAWYPGYGLRLFNKKRGSFTTTVVHESFVVTGPTRYLKNPLNHYPYQDLFHYLTKMNSYTTLSAQQMAAAGKKTSILSLGVHSLFSFIKSYFLCKGFLDGKAGLVCAVLGSFYTFIKYAKLWQLLESEHQVKNTDY
ncbi:MAG: glycosyltransferase family 2 protein [Chitinivibrionales bacterium]|nr:glycosyltransferase family 2 protein [Chitinivibrionales bacterium]